MPTHTATHLDEDPIPSNSIYLVPCETQQGGISPPYTLNCLEILPVQIWKSSAFDGQLQTSHRQTDLQASRI